MHTKGPWQCNAQDFTEYAPGQWARKCLVSGLEFNRPYTNLGHAVDDARLIAAAPELLEALQQIAEGKGRFSRDPLTHASNTVEDMKALAEAAIAKAEA